MGIVEFVDAIVSQEIFQGFLDEPLIIGVAQSSANQHGGAIADIAGNGVVGRFWAMKMPQHGIHRMNQVQTGVNQGAVQVKNEEFNPLSVKGTIELNHRFGLPGSPLPKTKEPVNPVYSEPRFPFYNEQLSSRGVLKG